MYLIHSVVINPFLNTFNQTMVTLWYLLQDTPDDLPAIVTAQTGAYVAFTALWNSTDQVLIAFPANPFRLELLKYLAPPTLPDLPGLAQIRAIWAQQLHNAISPV